uniref:Polyadenylate-binding protein 1-B n=1 Tax=Lygus hesperus TaxID=30085 RepID=A0A0A9WJ44_LYGHE
MNASAGSQLLAIAFLLASISGNTWGKYVPKQLQLKLSSRSNANAEKKLNSNLSHIVPTVTSGGVDRYFNNSQLNPGNGVVTSSLPPMLKPIAAIIRFLGNTATSIVKFVINLVGVMTRFGYNAVLKFLYIITAPLRYLISLLKKYFMQQQSTQLVTSFLASPLLSHLQ